MTNEENFVTCEYCGEKVPALFWGGACVNCTVKAVVKRAK